MQINILPMKVPLDHGAVISSIEVTSTEGFNVGDTIEVNNKLFTITWVEPMPKELHPALQFFVKLLFAIGIFSACAIALALAVFIICILTGAIHAISNYSP